MSPLPAHWRRRLQQPDRPAYLLLAELIAEDVRSGRLVARDRLPTLRELAQATGLNYTTVARGYAEAQRRGLIDAQSGRGSYVRGSAPALPLRGGAAMTMNLPPEPDDPALLARIREGAQAVFGEADLHALLRYQAFGGSAEDRAAGADWLAAQVPGVTAERTLVAPGIHSVLVALISQFARPGQLICVECLGYPGLKAIAAQLGVQLHALPCDEEGPSALAFEHACKHLQPRALYLNPTLQNPSTLTISRARRELLADLALHHSVPIIEDEAYAMLPARLDAPALSTLAPGLGWYVSGLSKCFGAGLRTAYVAAPSAREAERLAGTLRGLSVMASPLSNALATRWLRDGTAARMLDAVRQIGRERQALARELLGAVMPARTQGAPGGPPGLIAPEDGFHAWLRLGPPWQPVELAAWLRDQGVGAVASVAFSTDGDPPDALRLCLGGPQSHPDCRAMLGRLAEALDHPRAAQGAAM